jgi:hypothetical protein
VPAVEHWSCAECRYWVALEKVTGTCRRYPPIPQLPADGLLAAFPITVGTSWCGEFKRRY